MVSTKGPFESFVASTIPLEKEEQHTGAGCLAVTVAVPCQGFPSSTGS